MGFFSDLAALARMADAPFASAPSEIGIRSPFAGDLSRIVIPDLLSLFGIDETLCLNREQAMSLPAVFRARAILLSLIADKPLQAHTKDGLVKDQPAFLYRTPGILGPWGRMARTIDDLIFYPYSLWLTARGAVRNGRKDILNAMHCPIGSWKINEVGLIELKNEDGGWDVADEDEVILFVAPSEGLLAYASRVLAGSAAIDEAWVTRARNPSPITELHLTDDTQLDDEEVTATVESWVNARRAANGAVALTPSNVEVVDHGGDSSADLYIEGRNASRLDTASFFNMPGALLDATTATASLTYVTQEGTRADLFSLTLPYWVRPIEARLSQDDILPMGQSVRFDFSSLAPLVPTINTED